jgi:hypothetical protein
MSCHPHEMSLVAVGWLNARSPPFVGSVPLFAAGGSLWLDPPGISEPTQRRAASLIALAEPVLAFALRQGWVAAGAIARRRRTSNGWSVARARI